MKWIGGALVFLAELGMYVALGWYGAEQFDGVLAWVAPVLLVVAVAAIWFQFLAPKARRPLPPAPQLIVRTLLLAGGAAAFFAVGASALAVAQIAVIVIGTPLMAIWPPEEPPASARP